ncbi:MAG: hypothetical protein GY940_04705 [bacterium]|nr:hypothetical protein [bacterium]
MDKIEEKQLKRTVTEFSKGVEAFNKRDYKKADGVFDNLVKQNEQSGHYELQAIQARATVYKNICQSKLNPVTIELESDTDYLFDGIYQLNAGDLETAAERFEYLEKEKFDDPYLHYLMALLYLKKDEPETCLEHLGTAIAKDEFYQVIAHNEPDFGPMFENETFIELISH